jgi:membrane fusion protein, multidrug efflux system
MKVDRLKYKEPAFEAKKKQIPRADYGEVFKWRSAPRRARNCRCGIFVSKGTPAHSCSLMLPLANIFRSCACVLVIIACLSLAGCEKEQAAPPPPPDVTVTEVRQQDVPITKDWVGTLDGKVNAQIHAQVTGYLIKQNYINGAFVRKGTLLFQIDPRPFQAALDQAKGNLLQAQGNLDRAQAVLGKTEIDVTRYTPLAKESAISQQELDDAIQANLAAKGSVAADKAAIEAAKAAVDSAQLNLGFTSITSPVDGVAAIATAQVGDLVGPQSPTALTTVSTVNPILVNFNPSEQEYLNAAKLAGGEEFLRKLEFGLELATGATYPHKGSIYAVNREVDVRTGAIQVQAEFPNPDNVLRPGGFARISTVVGDQKGALVVPQRAVNELQGSFQIAVVGNDNKADIRTVKMGPKTGAMWVVAEGLKPGERVVAEGFQKLKEGMVVNPKPYQENEAATNP